MSRSNSKWRQVNFYSFGYIKRTLVTGAGWLVVMMTVWESDEDHFLGLNGEVFFLFYSECNSLLRTM